jgi:hypothetical protein
MTLLLLFTFCSLTVSEATLDGIGNVFQRACKQPARCYAGLGVKLFLGGPGQCREVCSLFPMLHFRFIGDYQCGTCASAEELLSETVSQEQEGPKLCAIFACF